MNRSIIILVMIVIVIGWGFIKRIDCHICHRNIKNYRSIATPEEPEMVPGSMRRRSMNPPLELQIFFSHKIKEKLNSSWIEEYTKAFQNVAHFLTLTGTPSEHIKLTKCGYPEYFDNDPDFEETYNHKENSLFEFHGHFALFVHFAHGDDDVRR